MVKRNRLNTYKTTGGGVTILIRESAGINYTPLADLTAPDDKCTVIIQAKIKWNGRDFVATSLYNPPVSSRPRDRHGFSAEYTLSACARQGPNHIICGDFNAHSITWDSVKDVVESEEGAEIEELLRKNSAALGNTGDSTLRHSTTRKRSAVDLSIHMGDVIISDWRTIPALGFSDHTTIAFNIRRDIIANSGEKARQRTAKKETKFCYAKADRKKFNRQFDNAYRNFVDTPRKRKVRRKHYATKRSSQIQYRYITRPRSNPLELENRRISAAFQSAMKTIPQGCRRDPVPWWDEEIDDAIILRAQLRKIRGDKTADPATLEERTLNYKRQADVTRDLIRSKRTASWKKFATDNLRYSSDSRRTSSMIKILGRTERPSPIQILKDGANHIYETDKAKANAFHRIYALNCKPDSMLTGPQRKQLLACLGKLVDRIVTTRLDFIVEQKGILPHSQAGFRRGRTTEDPLLDLISDVHDLKAHGKRVDKSPLALLLLDLEKAFERFDSWIILRTMHRLGISSNGITVF